MTFLSDPMKHLFIILAFAGLFSLKGLSQDNGLAIKGLVFDADTRNPITGAYIIEVNSSPVNGTITDSSGKFSLNSRIGRISVKITCLGYEDLVIRDILVGSGKEVLINAGLTEKAVQTSEVVISSANNGRSAINQMATISTSTIRPDDALRYAGGFYDPSRIVNAFAGIITSNSDYSNDIVTV